MRFYIFTAHKTQNSDAVNYDTNTQSFRLTVVGKQTLWMCYTVLQWLQGGNSANIHPPTHDIAVPVNTD